MRAEFTAVVALVSLGVAPLQPAPTSSLSGRILESGSSSPVAGARMVIIPPNPRGGMQPPTMVAISDQDGQYRVDRLTAGEYRIQVEHPGHATVLRAVTVPVRAAQDGDLVIEKGGVISGRVLDTSGSPLVGVPMKVWTRNKNRPERSWEYAYDRSAPAATDDRGAFRIEGLEADDYELEVKPELFARDAPPIWLSTFSGDVTDRHAARPITVGTGQTISDQVIHVAPSPELSLSALSAGRAEPAHLTGRVVERSTNHPVAGATISVEPVYGGIIDPTPPTFRARTRSDGTFAVDVTTGSKRVIVDSAAFQVSTTSMTIRAGANTADVLLTRGGVVTGRVVGPTGAPVAGARVGLFTRMPGLSTMPGGSRLPPVLPAHDERLRQPAAMTDGRGEFRLFGVAPGDYLVQALPPHAVLAPPSAVWVATYFPAALDPAGARTISVGSAATVGDVSIRLATAPAYTVSGIVTDEAGAPVAGTLVSLSLGSGHTLAQAGVLGQTRTAADGTFVVGYAPPGFCRVVANASAERAGPMGSASVTVERANVKGVKVVVRKFP